MSKLIANPPKLNAKINRRCAVHRAASGLNEMLGARRWAGRTASRRGRQHAVRWRQTLPGPAAKTVETRTAPAGEALREGKTCDAPKRLKKRMLVKLA